MQALGTLCVKISYLGLWLSNYTTLHTTNIHALCTSSYDIIICLEFTIYTVQVAHTIGNGNIFCNNKNANKVVSLEFRSLGWRAQSTQVLSGLISTVTIWSAFSYYRSKLFSQPNQLRCSLSLSLSLSCG